MSPSLRQRSRRSFQLPMAVWLTVLWVLLWGRLGVIEVVGGFVVATVALRVFPLPPLRFDGTLRPRAFGILVFRFLADLVIASVQVAGIALRFGRQPLNAIVKVPLHSRSDLYLTLTAELVSLVPGSLLIEVSRLESTLYVHIIGVKDAADVEKARRRVLDQERRLMEAIASAKELAAYRGRVKGSSP